MSLQRMSTMLFNLIKITVLAYFLSPSEFGIFGVAIISLDILSYFSKTGFKQAIIQKQGEVRSYLNSAWTFGLGRSLILATLLFLLAPVFARFFHSQESILVIRAISVVFIVNALINIADLFLEKNLNFKKYFFYQTGSELIDIILSILFAILLKNYWALFIGYISKGIFKCILSYIIFEYKPKLELQWDKIRELMNFGKWIFASSVILVLALYLDNILVGKLIGITALGLYQVAFKFSHTGSGELTNVLSQIYFPYFSVIQDNKNESEKAYLNLLKLNVLLMSFLATGMVCLAPSFTMLFLKPGWHSIIGLIQILAIASFFDSVISTSNPYFKGKGNPRLIMVLQVIKLGTLLLFIFLLYKNSGIKGIAYSVIISEIITMLCWFVVLSRMISGFFFRLLKILIAPLFASVLMGISIALFWWIPGIHFTELSYLGFFAAGVSGTVLYASLIFLYTKLNPSYGESISFKKFFPVVLSNNHHPG